MKTKSFYEQVRELLHSEEAGKQIQIRERNSKSEWESYNIICKWGFKEFDFDTFEYRVKPDMVLPKEFDGNRVDDFHNFVQNHKFFNIYSHTKDNTTEEAFFQLIIMRDYYNDGWEPNWGNYDENKYCIDFINEKIHCTFYHTARKNLAFKTAELRDEFLKNFKESIIQAKELL